MLRQGTITRLIQPSLAQNELAQNGQGQLSMVVSLDPPAGCSSCRNGAGCGAGLFGSLFASRSSHVIVPQFTHCAEGERVALDIPSSVALKMAFTGYFLPVLAMMLCAMLCQHFVSAQPLYVAACGFVGLALGLIGGVFAYPVTTEKISAGPNSTIQITRLPPRSTEFADN